MSARIPLAKPQVTDADRQAVMSVLRTPHLSLGPKLREFEHAICRYTGAKFAVAVNSGTSALHLAIRALKLEPGAEVVLPSFTFSALLNVILQEGLCPRFVDINPATYNTTPELIDAAISPRTCLILAVHTFGFPLDAEAITRIAKRHSRVFRKRARHAVHTIEDACEALGASVRGHKAGTLGEAGLFAFYPNKQITTGEGGVLVTSDPQIATTSEHLRNQGRDPKLGLNNHSEEGFSYRISDINCALGVSQMSRIESIVAKRQRLAETYDRALAGIGEMIIRPPLRSPVGRISWFVYPIQLASEFTARDRDWICTEMLRRGIASGRYFAPLHRQPVIADHRLSKRGEGSSARFRRDKSLFNTEAVADRVIALPFFNQLTVAEVHEVAGALDESLRELRRKMYSRFPSQGN